MEFPVLAWTMYSNANERKYRLYLIVGEKGDKYICFAASDMPDPHIDLIRDNIDDLRKMDTAMASTWLRQHIDDWRKYYKEIYKERLSIEDVFEVPKKGKPKEPKPKKAET
jgi:DNA-binding GntR family transcriptional regulator